MNEQLEKEFTTLLNRNKKVLFKVCWMFFNNEEYDFKELKQEILCALWKEYARYGMSRFGTNSKESTWVFTIAWRVAMNYKRDNSRRNLLFDVVPIVPEETLIFEMNDDADFFNYVISALDDEDRRWFLYYLDRFTYESISEREKVSEKVARKRMSRVIRKVRKLGEIL